jgi:hypothetical protein
MNNNAPIRNLNRKNYILNHYSELTFWHHELMMSEVLLNSKLEATSVSSRIKDSSPYRMMDPEPMEVMQLPDHIDEESISDWIASIFE